jgi:uncharacterized damage-inducible protein DinB
MTVAEVQELFAFNAWANRRIFDGVGRLAEADYLRDLKSSHGGIHGTLCHLVWAEELWLHRWLGMASPAVPQGRDLASLPDVRARWEAVEAERAPFLRELSEAKLASAIVVKPTMGGEYRHTLGETFRHVVDHSSYHRGQIITLTRQLGVKPPSTGLILFYRERATGRETANF